MSAIKALEAEVFNNAEASKAYEIEEQINRLSNLFRKIRTDKGLTQCEVAKRTGLSPQMISKIESYNGNPTLTTLVKYCNCLEIDLYQLIRTGYYNSK